MADHVRSGRPPVIGARERAKVVARALKPPPAGLSHWSAREIARKVDLSPSTVHRIWRAHALAVLVSLTLGGDQMTVFAIAATTWPRFARLAAG